MLTAASEVPPAGGAALGEVVLASALGAGLSLALLLVVHLHRSRRTTLLQRAADALGRSMGTPGWVALPVAFTTVSLLTALFGMYWDISLHIGQGRDSGPLANPAHYFILFGLFGIFAGGVLAVSLPLGERPGPASVRVTEGWYAPVGGLLVAGAGCYALLGFPLDDVWHRIFGQDVTLWGPTHLMLIGGAGLSLVGMLVLEKEGGAGRVSTSAPREWVRRAFAMGGLLIGLSVFQGEYDFGVPQFRLVLQPALLAVAAGVALVAARAWTGRGGALAAAAFYLGVHSVVSLLVGPVLGEVTPHFPLYLGSAVLVELVALVVRPDGLRFGVVAGAVVGTLGTLTEGLWSQVFMRLPWGSDVAVEAAWSGLVCGVAGGTVGALLALGLQGRLHEVRRPRPLYLASLLAVAAVVGNGLVATVPGGGTPVDVAVTEAGQRNGVRYVDVAARIPDRLVDDPSWVQVTSWQGGGLVVSPMERGADGTWRTTEPVPASGSDWKTMVRVHDGRALTALPVYLPEDAAVGAEQVPATASTRELGSEIRILQRERKEGVPGWLFGAGSLVVLACSLVLLLSLAWGVQRVSGGPGVPEPAARRAPEPVA